MRKSHFEIQGLSSINYISAELTTESFTWKMLHLFMYFFPLLSRVQNIDSIAVLQKEIWPTPLECSLNWELDISSQNPELVIMMFLFGSTTLLKILSRRAETSEDLNGWFLNYETSQFSI